MISSSEPNFESTDQTNIPQDFPMAYPTLNLSAQFKSCPEDFVVNENLGFKPTGEGEHCLLHIEKTGQNTQWVADQLALNLNLDKKAVGYCGRKDRHAVTRQWLSIYDPHRHISIDDEFMHNLAIEGVTLLEHARHSHKLRPGDHVSNQFHIRLRNVNEGAKESEKSLEDNQKLFLVDEIMQRLLKGVPNYFGAQRFGRDGSNLRSAANWFEKKQTPPRRQKSMVMSAARSYVFNTVLAARVHQNCWASDIKGDVLVNSIPTAPLWGRGRLASETEALLLEEAALAELSSWCHGLEHCGLKQERRATVLAPINKQFKTAVEFDGDDLVLTFELAAGAFATSILAEVAVLREA